MAESSQKVLMPRDVCILRQRRKCESFCWKTVTVVEVGCQDASVAIVSQIKADYEIIFRVVHVVFWRPQSALLLRPRDREETVTNA